MNYEQFCEYLNDHNEYARDARGFGSYVDMGVSDKDPHTVYFCWLQADTCEPTLYLVKLERLQDELGELEFNPSNFDEQEECDEAFVEMLEQLLERASYDVITFGY